jgi:hypothetical protein
MKPSLKRLHAARLRVRQWLSIVTFPLALIAEAEAARAKAMSEKGVAALVSGASLEWNAAVFV